MLFFTASLVTYVLKFFRLYRFICTYSIKCFSVDLCGIFEMFCKLFKSLFLLLSTWGDEWLLDSRRFSNAVKLYAWSSTELNLPFFDSINSDGESVFENLLRVWYHIGVRLSLADRVVFICVCIVLQLSKLLTWMSIILQTGVLFASSLCLRLKLDYFASWDVSIFL